jgi:hypothetical protein
VEQELSAIEKHKVMAIATIIVFIFIITLLF